jgi:hypothetical protein
MGKDVRMAFRQRFLAACAAVLAAAAFSPARAATEIAITVDNLPGHAFDRGDREDKLAELCK